MTDTIDSLRAERDELRVRLREVADWHENVADELRSLPTKREEG